MAAGRKEVRDSERVICSLTPGSFYLDEQELVETVSRGLKPVRPRSDSDPSNPAIILFRQPHWKPIPRAPKCASPSCGKKLSSKLGQCRNCAMCGDVFCYQCTNYRRRLSLSAYPDDLFGTLQSVCNKCFRRAPSTGLHRDHTSEFKRYRAKMVAAHMAEAEKTLCCSKYTPAKRNAILKAVDRLSQGFAKNSGCLRSLKPVFGVPDWQKPPHWIDRRSMNHCYNCNIRFTRMSTKINCRIGGQVFCKECGKHEIMIYLEDKNGLPKWRINGKGQMRKPAHFGELYPICSGCTGDLETILIEKLDLLRQNDAFVADVLVEQENLSNLQRKIDKWLPDYQQAIGALDHQVSGITKNKKLVKLHLDMRDALSVVRDKFDEHLLKLRPQSAIQKRLLQRIQTGVCLCYKEHFKQYSNTKKQLVQHLPSCRDASGSDKQESCCNSSYHDKSTVDVEQDLISTQKALSQQSMESVYIDISQLIHDLSRNYGKHFDVDSLIHEGMMKIVQSIKDELCPFLDGESWDDHFKLAMMNRESQINVSEHLKSYQNTVKIVVVQQCSVILHKCYFQLQAETLDQEFLRTKMLLNEMYMRLENYVSLKR